MRLTLDDILLLRPLRVLHADERRRVTMTGVSTDSRTVRKGDLFFALRGDKFDGHNFLTKAAGLGAHAAIIEQRWAETNQVLLASLRIPVAVVDDSLAALGALAAAYREKYSIPVIAVGGSNGKTTTKEMISAVLKRRFSVLRLCLGLSMLRLHLGVMQFLVQ